MFSTDLLVQYYSAAPERPWDPSAWVQLQSCAYIGSPWIKRRSVTPNRVNKWQMLWNSLSSVTTEGLKGPGDHFHMKAASQQNHGKPLPALQTGWNWHVLVSAHIHNKNTNRHTNAGFERFICFAHGLTEPALEIKCAVWTAWARAPQSFFPFFLMVLGQSGLSCAVKCHPGDSPVVKNHLLKIIWKPTSPLFSLLVFSCNFSDFATFCSYLCFKSWILKL